MPSVKNNLTNSYKFYYTLKKHIHIFFTPPLKILSLASYFEILYNQVTFFRSLLSRRFLKNLNKN